MKISKRLLALFLISALAVSSSVSAGADNSDSSVSDGVSASAVYNAVNSEYNNDNLSNENSTKITANVGEKLSLSSSKNNSWKSSNSKLAKVDKKGNVTCLSAGKCTVTATQPDGTKETFKLNINQPVSSINIKKPVTYLNVGSVSEISSTVSPDNATNKKLDWQSSNSDIATVDENGIVQAKKAGSCKIIAKAKDNSEKQASCQVVVSQPVTSVEVSSRSIVINNGETKKLHADVAPSNASSKCVIWKSSNTNVASVSSTGVVTANGAGSCTVKAYSADGSNISDYCSVTVIQKASDMEILNAPETINVGDKTVLSAVVTPSYASSKLVKWSCSNTNVAEVSSRGIVTAKASGSCVITASTTDGTDITKSFTLKVTQPVTSLEMNESVKTLKEGCGGVLRAFAYPLNADDKSVLFISSNTNVATVDARGVLHAKEKGTCTIYAYTKDGSNLRTSCVLNVERPVQNVVTEQEEISVYAGKTASVNASVSPADASNTNLIYTSSNPEIASVDENGIVTAIAKGTCSITCTSAYNNKISAVCTVDVKQPVSSIKINGDSKLKEKSSIRLSAEISPYNADNTTVSWSSSDKSIATVDADGKVTGVKPGSVKIKCTAKDGSNVSSEKKITVESVKTKGEKIADFAAQWVGVTPYVWGGTSLKYGADCSGFVCSVYKNFGYDLWWARVNLDMVGRPVSLSEAKPGDIVLFPGHVAIYAGNGQVTHAMNERLGVKTTPISWGGYVRCVRRVVD